MGARKGNELANVVLVLGKGDRLRYLPIDRGIRRIQLRDIASK